MPLKSLRFVVFGFVLGIVVLFGATTLRGSAEGALEDAPAPPTLTDDQQEEADELATLLDNVLVGKQPAPAAYALSWQNDFMKAAENLTYVPFTVSFDAVEVGGSSVAMFVRVIEPQPEPAENAEREVPDPVFEDVHFVELGAADAGQQRLQRAFALPAGEYEVHVLLKAQLDEETPTRIASLQHPLSVPDFWAGALVTSSVIVAERLEPSPPLSPAEQAANPYTLGSTRIVPAADLQFSPTEELSLVFLIYNPRLDGNKPDVTVEYTFHQQASEGETYFNKTNPQHFNAQTLPPQFDMVAGHQLVAGQSVPLSGFTEGEYRLEIKVVDNESGENLTHEVRFTVAGP